ncbi:hypothetical protein LTR78_000423 [Recurvomyces mirabilis]|uniref:Uncharacterized protein n=1 Tax=Recurvomyces mirabilis TaxID=574656 RepID=A0AAE1C6J8_9PEZI|nr:hypothetical protein LTR78_000423 [Recurvomyces mirabilis]KAK5162078.1 hypothetical protein LTS14_000424 [Recurvomyces mirabilis]
MHWHARNQSTRAHEDAAHEEEIQLKDASDHIPDDEDSDHYDLPTSIPLGNDDAADVKTGCGLPDLCLPLRDVHVRDTQPEACESSLEAGDDFLQRLIPTSTPGTTPFGYQQALKNRLMNGKLQPHGEYDMHAFTPTFIHDCLMLPGSLTQLLKKLDTPETIRRMTPALLPGFHAYVQTDTLKPCIMPSLNTNEYVQGMVVFGQGKESRNLIHQHYRENCRRVKVEVEIDVSAPVSSADRDHPLENWRLQRRKVWAHAWLWANVGSGEVKFRSQAERWTIEDYLSGALESHTEPINIQEVWPDVDVDVDDDDAAGETKLPKREIVYGGRGHLDYIVEKHFTGW